MGRLSLSDVNEQVNGVSANNEDRPYYWYFGLPKEGDSAIIRIMHDSVEDLEVLATHEVRIDGKYRKVSCLRGEKDSLDMCPLCTDDFPRKKILYLHLIEYVTDSSSGQVIPTPRIWERPLGFIGELKEYMEAYAPLSDQVFKVKRTGTGPSTRYTFIPLNNNVAPESVYGKHAEFFESYQALGVNVQERDAENIIKLMEEGKIIPVENKYSNSGATKPVQRPVAAPVATVQAQEPILTGTPFDDVEVPTVTPVVPPFLETPVAAPVTPAPQNWANPTPRRVYNPGAPATSNTTTGFRPTRM